MSQGVVVSSSQSHGSKKKKEKEEKESDEKCVECATNVWPPGSHAIDVTFDMFRDITALRKRYQPQFEDLMTRKFIPAPDASHHKGTQLIVLQFNMLADILSGAYSIEDDASSFLGVDKRCLSWKYRGVRVVEEILRWDPDIVCIQECDQEPFVRQYLARYGYEVHFQAKADSPCHLTAQHIATQRGIKDLEVRPDGVLIAFKSSKLKLAGSKQGFDSRRMQSLGTGLVIPVCLLNGERDKEFLIFSTHLRESQTLEGEKARMDQLTEFMTEMISNPKGLAIIFCVDLNGCPIRNKDLEPLCYKRATGPFNFTSAYRAASKNDSEPPFTTCRIRQGGIDQSTIDYIFYRCGKGVDFKVTHVLSVPDITPDDTSKVSPMPSFAYPSDHFALVAKLCVSG